LRFCPDDDWIFTWFQDQFELMWNNAAPGDRGHIARPNGTTVDRHRDASGGAPDIYRCLSEATTSRALDPAGRHSL
jgi:hypothetical protein